MPGSLAQPRPLGKMRRTPGGPHLGYRAQPGDKYHKGRPDGQPPMISMRSARSVKAGEDRVRQLHKDGQQRGHDLIHARAGDLAAMRLQLRFVK